MMNGGAGGQAMMDEILLPDENTQEMAVDCPDNFLSKSHHEAESSMVSGMSYLVDTS